MFSRPFSFFKLNQQGFSVLEVLITSAIIALVTALVLVRYDGFNNSILMKNQAYEIALAFREAQVFSLGVRSDNDQFRVPYGLYVGNLNQSPVTEIIVFQDVNNNGLYNPGGTTPEPVIETLVIDSRFEIFQICTASSPGGALDCGRHQAYATFQRPDFDARLKVRQGGSTVPGEFAELVLRLQGIGGSPVKREIWVSSSGQIAVK